MEEIVYHTNYRLEDTYWWFLARNEIIGKIIEKITSLEKGEQILDAGCGTGGFSKYLSKKYDVICLDFSETALDYCRRRGLTKLYKTTISEFPKEQFNIKAVTMFDVVEHVDDDAGFLRQAYNALPEGGWIISTVPAYMWLWSRHDDVHQHKRRYTISGFRNLVENGGFKIEYSSYFNFFLFLPAVLKRFLDDKLHKEKKNESPVDEVSPFVNRLFKAVFTFEKFFLPALKFPFGLSIALVARKI
ncbi:MAG: hypothetical protein QG635_1954 [Bacteroidota bacterium]|nr:hypothetical protein [Bacteroidota bacterium]